jgi:hypothetical protein
MTPEQAAALREPFPPAQIGKLPKGGAMLDFVGHAAITDRLLRVDPGWVWEPVAWDDDGTPLIQMRGKDAVMWIRLTVAGVTRLGVGTAPASAFDLPKQLISDALRNAAMRFGVALDLWSREDLGEHTDRNTGAAPTPPPAATQRGRQSAPDATPPASGADAAESPVRGEVARLAEELDDLSREAWNEWKADWAQLHGGVGYHKSDAGWVAARAELVELTSAQHARNGRDPFLAFEDQVADEGAAPPPPDDRPKMPPIPRSRDRKKAPA